MKANYILITTFTFLGLFHEYAMSQTKQSFQVDADPASKIKCEEIRMNDRLEINYWTIRSIAKNKVLLDFGNLLRFPCENYRENIYAFSESGEIVPLTFVKVISPQMTYQWYSKKESKICHCMAKKEHLYGFCDQLEGDGTYGLDVEKTKCRYIAEYTFDPKFKLKAKTLAIHLPDVQNTKYEHFKMTPLIANSPEGKAFTEKKFYMPDRYSPEKERYTTYHPSKTSCMNIPNCDVFANTPTGWKPLHESVEYRAYPFGECYLINTSNSGCCGRGGGSCQGKDVCEFVGFGGSFQLNVLPQIQGKLTFKKDGRELYIFYYESDLFVVSHLLFDPKLHGFGAAIVYYKDPCDLVLDWLALKEAEAKKAAQDASTSGSGSGEAKAGE